MRLRRLSEAECYTRCYGGKPGERVTAVRLVSQSELERRKSARRRSEQEEERAA